MTNVVNTVIDITTFHHLVLSSPFLEGWFCVHGNMSVHCSKNSKNSKRLQSLSNPPSFCSTFRSKLLNKTFEALMEKAFQKSCKRHGCE
ncbi:CLUMA_CG001595, isoform A [Clunio marinus]|uniref:CLUMA_CG001595, isoform A n=1 Tax=Clunio marinus TaxID=568069 RepID=A0A1J1HNE3_9DIPT|nr:CLUMA_CG001595, isoform A [Clunio marinus]